MRERGHRPLSRPRGDQAVRAKGSGLHSQRGPERQRSAACAHTPRQHSLGKASRRTSPAVL